jgi:hypothetical protein
VFKREGYQCFFGPAYRSSPVKLKDSRDSSNDLNPIIWHAPAAFPGKDTCEINFPGAGGRDPVPDPREASGGPEDVEVAGSNPEVQLGEGIHYNQTGTWRDLLPFRKLSPVEWDAYQRKKKADFQAK